MDIHNKIIQLRRERGFSQEVFAHKLDVSRQAVSKWELGQSVPDVDNILRMADLFGVSLDYLLKDESPRSTEPSSSQRVSRGSHQKVASLILLATGLLSLILMLVVLGTDMMYFLLFAGILFLILSIELLCLSLVNWKHIAWTVWGYFFVLINVSVSSSITSLLFSVRHILAGEFNVATILHIGLLGTGLLLLILSIAGKGKVISTGA